MLEGLPVILDPWFHAVAVPAVLLTGLAKPLMALSLPVPQAAAIT